MSAITQFLIAHGGLFLFLIGFAEQSGLPIPGAPWLLAAGALAGTGRFSLIAAICWAAIGSLVADATWFYVGQRGKARIFRVFPHLHAVRSRLHQATRTDSILHGAWMLTAAKFLPFGTVVPLHAGALEVGRCAFCSWMFLLGLLRRRVCPLGILFPQPIGTGGGIHAKAGRAALLLIVILAGTYVVYRFLKRSPKRVTDIIQNGAKVEETHVLHTHNCRTVCGRCFSGKLRTQRRKQILNAEPSGSELPV